MKRVRFRRSRRSAGDEVIAVSAKPKKRLRNAVARAGDEVIAVSAKPKKRLRNAVARAGEMPLHVQEQSPLEARLLSNSLPLKLIFG
jgi:hypothetical protein